MYNLEFDNEINRMYFLTNFKNFLFLVIYAISLLLSKKILNNLESTAVCSVDRIEAMFRKIGYRETTPGENCSRLQQACSSFRDLQQACSRPAFSHMPARGLQHTRKLNRNITFIYKCSICGCALGLLQKCY